VPLISLKTKDLKPIVLESSMMNNAKPATTVMIGTHLASKRAVPSVVWPIIEI